MKTTTEIIKEKRTAVENQRQLLSDNLLRLQERRNGLDAEIAKMQNDFHACTGALQLLDMMQKELDQPPAADSSAEESGGA